MAINKPEIPSAELPEDWGGIQTPYTEQQTQEGYPEAIPTVIDGGNLNFEKRGIFKNIKYLRVFSDWLRNMPIGKIPVVNSKGQLDYGQPVLLASDEEYIDGQTIEKSPTVKQVRDSFLDVDGKITNCITEIPQDIKLELVDGTLTLKAGSKVYVPNGVGKFDEQIVSSDVVVGNRTGGGVLLLSVRKNSNAVDTTFIGNCLSGASLTPATASLHYDTANNIIRRYSSSVDTYYESSLPIALINLTDGVYTSIDQVFNGFGYIGSTVFALPGVKGLSPNGRNDDGSLRNIEFTTSKVLTGAVYNSKYVMHAGKLDPAYHTNYAEQEEQPSFVNGDWYQPSTNIMCRIVNGVATPNNAAYVLDLSASGGKATGINPKLPFRAVDYNDFSQLNQKFKVVTELPSNPDVNVFYFVTE